MLGGRAAILLLILLLHHEREPSLFGQLSSQVVFQFSLQYLGNINFLGCCSLGEYEHLIPNYVTSIPAMNNSLESSASGNSTNPANFHDHFCETRRKFTPKLLTIRGWRCFFCAPRQEIVLTNTALSHHFIKTPFPQSLVLRNFTPDK